MGKEFKNIDDLFQSELGGEMHAAPDFVKTNIDQSLGFHSKRRGFLILGSIAFIGIIFTTAMYIGYEDELNTQDNHLVTSPDINTSTSHYKIKKKLADNHLMMQTNEADMNSLFAVNRNDHSKQLDFVAPSQTYSQSQPAERALQLNPTTLKPTVAPIFEPRKINNPTISPRVEIEQSASEIPAPIQTDKPDTEVALETEIRTETEVTSDTEIEPPTVELTSLPVDEANIEAENQIAASNPNPASFPLDNSTEIPATTEIPNTDTVLVADQPADIIPAKTLDADSTDSAPSIEIELPSPTPYKPWMISLTSGINKVNTAYTADKLMDKTIYDNAASDLLGYQTNLDFTYRLKNGLTVGSGLGFSTFKEELVFKQNILETTTIQDIEFEYDYVYQYDYYYTVDTSGAIFDSTAFVVDSNYVLIDSSNIYSVDKKTRENSVNGSNTATYFHIPLSFGTQMRFNKFQLDLFANLRFNFRIQSEGVYNRNDAIYSFNESNSIYRPFYMDVVLGSKVHYNVWNNLYVTGTLQYRPVMGMAYKNLPFNKSYDYLHFGVGLSFRL